jgi:dienelactone hydrolase
VGLVSWSVGGVSQALLRLEAPADFRAAVSLDSGSGYAYGADLLRQAGGVDASRLTVPFLHFDVGRATTPVPKDDSFLRAHPVGVARRVLLEDMRHADFTLPYGAGRAAATGQAPPAAAPTYSRELLSFLEAQLPTRHTEERVVLTSDGWSLVGDVALPDGPERVPAALLLNKAAGDRHAYRGLAEALARRGVASLRLDLRAHGESTNLGRFAPPDGRALLDGSDRDVAAGLDALRRHSRVDGSRIAVVGSSYSGEAMMEAGRKGGWAAAYVGLSPGSLSDESIAAIDRDRLPWLLVVCRDERYLKEVEKALREQSRTAEFLELPGTRHAIDLLGSHPGFVAQLALWLEQRLAAAPERPIG